ncbi:MAG: DUF6665 family protein [Devosia sp.]
MRDSLDLIAMVKPEAGTTALDHEIMAERASSLGAAEHKVIAALAALTAAADSHDLLQRARNAVWAYFVQRELIGFRRHADVIHHLGIPPQVLAGLGAFERCR